MTLSHPRVLAVLGGQDQSLDNLELWTRSADIVLAADSGADRVMATGRRPDIAIGDLDSISTAAREAAREVIEIFDQDHTDCDKLLMLAARHGYKALTVFGLEGDRLDHVLASLFSVLRCDLRIRLALRGAMAILVRPQAAVEWPTRPGRRISLIPLEPSQGVTLSGVRWPLLDADLAPRGLISVSNEAASDFVSASVRSGSALLMAEVSPEEMPLW